MTPFQLNGILDGPLGSIVVVGGVIALLAGLASRVWVERRRNPFRPSLDRSPTSDSEETPDSDLHDPVEPNRDAEELMTTAEDRFSQEDFTGTIQAAYMHTRAHLAGEYGVGTGGTHWSFYETCLDTGLEGEAEALEELTAIYERAAFDRESIGRTEAERALELAAELSAQPPESN